MKLRIKGNSLRLRLTQSEVTQLGETGRVSETIKFGVRPDQELTYTLESSIAAEKISSYFADNQITVTLPLEKARMWIDTEMVGLSDEQNIHSSFTVEQIRDGKDDMAASELLKLLIEKDFKCADGDPAEDQSDAFPNPNLKC